MLRHTLVMLGVIAMSALIAYRSYIIPITHDEASTWLNYRHINVWSCFANPSCWGTANNHWLNTVLLQISASIFGEDPWALRLPNVMGGVAYLLCAALICGRWIENYALQLAGFLFLCAHVYLIDFFSLARGYGLMTCFVMWSVYAFLRYREAWERKWLLISIGALILSVLSNFTALLAWASMGGTWLVFVLLSGKNNFVWRHGMYWVASALILFLLLFVPVKTLSGSGEFAWGTSGPLAMGVDLVRSLLYGVRYFGDETYLYGLYLALFFIGITLIAALISRQKEKKQSVLLMILLLTMNILAIVVLQKITGSMAPEGRKSLYLIPILFGVFALGLGLVPNTGTASFAGIILSLAFIGHMIRTLPLASTREWYYDAYYPQLLNTIFPDGVNSDSAKVGSTWIFNPALGYYTEGQHYPMSGLAYVRPLEVDSTVKYYFVEQQDTAGMLRYGFDLEKRIGPFLLMRNNKN